MTKTKALIASFCILLAASESGAQATVPNSFSNGTTAIAAEVNANFTAVLAYIDDLIADVAAVVADVAELVSDALYRPEYYAEDYGVGLAGINAALAACDAAADAGASKPGIVYLPRGQTTIAVTSGDTCPLIDMPETDNGGSDNRWASCQLVGWGMNPSQNDLTNTSNGSTLYFTNPDSMVDCTGSRDTIIRFGGFGQVFKDFTLAMDGTATTDYDNTRMMLLQSSARGLDPIGAYGVKGWSIERVNFAADGSTGEGVGFESIFGLDGAVRDSWFQNFRVGYLPTSLAGTANNANTIENCRFAGNDDAILIDDGLACQDTVLIENTIESNGNGVHLTNDASCHVTMIGNHFEQTLATGSHDVWLEGSAGSVTIIGGAMMGDLADADHIVFAAAQASADTPTHFIQGVRFIDHDQVNFTAAAGVRMVINEDFSRASPIVPTASANDSDTSAASTAFVQQEINGAGGTDLTCASGSCDVDAAVTRDSELAAYTTGTSTPTDGSTACNTGDMHLETDAFKIYFCVDGATDDWYGTTLTDTP